MADVELEPARTPLPWLTKPEAARRLNVTERTIENYVSDRRIGMKLQPMKGRRALPLLDPDDVDRLLAEQNQGAIVVPETPQRASAELDALVRVAEVLAARWQPPPSPRMFMALREAAAFSGLPAGLLRRLIRAGRLPAERFAGVVYIKATDVRNVELSVSEGAEKAPEAFRMGAAR